MTAQMIRIPFSFACSASIIHTPRLTAYPSQDGTADAQTWIPIAYTIVCKWTAPARRPLFQRGATIVAGYVSRWRMSAQMIRIPFIIACSASPNAGRSDVKCEL